MPIMRCMANGKRGYKWGNNGKCYRTIGEAMKQAKAIEASKNNNNNKRR